MQAGKRWLAVILVLAVVVPVISCRADEPVQPLLVEIFVTRPPVFITATPEPTATPTATRTPYPTRTPTITPTPIPVEWRSAGRGIEVSDVPALNPILNLMTSGYAVRIDPADVQFLVYVDSENPRTIEEWLAHTGANIVVNGGFFGFANEPVGRIVVNGVQYGYRYNMQGRIGYAGAFIIDDDAADVFTLRGSAGQRLQGVDLGVEAYPMLLDSGAEIIYRYNNVERRNRRTAVGLDRDGNLVLAVIDAPMFSLYEMAAWLQSADLGLESALGLDGGRSSGIGVNLPGETRIISSYVELPIVIAITIAP